VPTPALTYHLTAGALLNGDTLTGALSRQAGEALGSYPIEQGTLAPPTNYSLTFISTNLTITTATLVITADEQGKTYGEADPALTYQITGGVLIGGDTLTGALTRVAGENVGLFTIQQGTLAATTNYSITFIPATLEIERASLTVRADAKSKVYGATDPGLTYQISFGALVGSDTFSGALTRVAGEAVRSYTISQGTLTAGNNYELIFNSANLTITPAPLAVSAGAQTKVYGAADPLLTCHFTSGALVGSDTFSGSLTRVPGENIGSYAIQQGTLTAGTNYTLSFTSANLAITAAPLSVAADPKSKGYGNVDPPLTWHITSGALVGGDTLNGGLTLVAGENLGAHAIQQGTLTASG